MESRVERWGDSLVVRIPDAVVQRSGFVESVSIDLECVRRGQVMIRASAPSASPSLDDLIDGITDENRHGEIETVGPVGAEAW